MAEIVVPARSTPRTQRRSARRGRGYLAGFSVAWLAVLVLLIVLAPVLPIADPTTIDYRSIRVPPGVDLAHPLGTDRIGRDILARVITGARVSLVVGVGAAVIAGVLGTFVGVVAGYFRGPSDRVISAGIDVVLAFPPLIAIIAFSVFLGPSLPTLVLALGIIFTPQVARVSRSATLTYGRREFVVAARSTGARHPRILWREILPNVTVPVLSYCIVLVALAIAAEGGMSFLGLGVPPPQSSWGSMMGQGRAELSSSPHIVLVPAAAMFLTLLALNFLAEYVSTRFDVKEAAL